MPDFGLTEALTNALKAAGKTPVMRAGEESLASSAARSAPAAPAVPDAAPVPAAPSAIPQPGAVAEPQLNPSQPPADLPPPDPSAVPGSPEATPQAPEDAAAPSGGAPPPTDPQADAPVAQTPAPDPVQGEVAPTNKLPPPAAPDVPPAPTPQAAAQRFITANIGDFGGKLNMTHLPNVDVMSSPDGVKAAILQVADDNKGVIEDARRGTITDEQLTGMAQDLAINGDVMKQVLSREFGTAIQQPEVILAARMVEQGEAGALVDLADRVANGQATPAEIVEWSRRSQNFVEYHSQLMGAKAESGRGMRAMGIPVGLPPEVMEHISGILQRNNPDMQATARAIQLAGTPAGVSNILSGMSQLGPVSRTLKYSMGLLQRIFINGILSGPSTWAKIFTGNTWNLATNAADIAFAGVGRGIYGAAARSMGFSTASEGASITDAFAHVHGVITGGADALRVAGRVLRTGQSMDGAMRVNEIAPQSSLNAAFPGLQDTYFGGIAHVIDRAIDMPGVIIGSIDDFTKTLGYRGYLTMMSLKEVQARATTGALRPGDAGQVMQELMSNPSPEMQQAAEAWAHRMTFQTPFPEGGSGEAFQAFLSKAPALRFIFPFMRTATNIFKQSLIERTPLAMFSARIRSQIAAGGFEGDLAKSRIATGTAVMGMLGWMAIHDRITGSAPKDAKERAVWGMDGRTENSIRITDPITGQDTWRSYKWFEPMASVAGTIADVVQLQSYIHTNIDSLQTHDDKINDAIAHIAASVIENTGDKTYMQGAAAFSEMYNDPKRAFQMWAAQTGASFVPFSGATRFVRNVQDPYLRQANTLIDNIRNNLPTIMGIKGSQTLPGRLDVFGEPRMHPGGNSILGPLNPIPGSPGKGDAVSDEIQSLMEQTRTVPIGMPSVRLAMDGSGKGLVGGQGMRLTPEEYNDYVTKSRSDPIFSPGIGLRERLEQVINTPTYQAAEPAVRATLLEHETNRADKVGAQNLYKDNDGFRERMQAWTDDKNRIKFGQ